MIRRWIDRTLGSGGILAYHGVGSGGFLPAMHVTPESFRKQMEFMQRRYSIVRLEELFERLRRGRGCEGCVAITFDDAYVGVASFAAPILNSLGLPATIFVSTHAAECGDQYWWDVFEIAARNLQSDTWSRVLTQVGAGITTGTHADFSEDLRKYVLKDLEGRVDMTSLAPEKHSTWRSMTMDELSTLALDNLFDFGVHTLSHPNLTRIPSADRETEIRQSYQELQERLPRVLGYVAYPYGLYDRATCLAASAAGMVGGFTMDGVSPTRSTPLLAIPRLGVGEVHSCRSIELRLSAAMRPLVNIRRGRWPRWKFSPAKGNDEQLTSYD